MIQSISLLVLGQRVQVEYDDALLYQLLIANFGAMARPGRIVPADLQYVIGESDGQLIIERAGHLPVRCKGPDNLLTVLEKCITVDLQKKRPDLLFLHSAAIEWQGKAYLFAADSGSGKSTTTWAMLHHGFGYLSDELSPIDLQSMRIIPYPHALCLKQQPPMPYPLPDETVHLGGRMHVPAESLPGKTVTEPLPLGGVFLLKYFPELIVPALRPIGHAEAGARLYLTALNALAHGNRGLDGIVKIVEHVPCYSVSAADLAQTCSLIRAAVARETERCTVSNY